MRTRKSADERKAQIMQATLRLAHEVGPDRLSTEAIARAVGITQPAVFRHFPTKQTLWAAVLDWIGEELQARWLRAELPAAGPIERLQALVAAQLDLIQTTPAIPSILFSRELHVQNEDLRQGMYQIMRRFHGRLTVILEDGIVQGGLRRGLDASRAASLIISLIQGLAVRWSLSSRSFDLVAEGRDMLAMTLEGLLHPRSTVNSLED